MTSEQYPNILEAQNVPYYEETQKRTFAQKMHKVRNTIYMLMAYACPNNNLRQWMHRRRGVHIGKNVYLGMFCFLDNLHPEYIYIEDNIQLQQHVFVPRKFHLQIHHYSIFSSRW